MVGGYTPEKVALRRAIALAYNSEQEIRLVRKAQAVPADRASGAAGLRLQPALKTSMSDHDPARPAMLDLYGYVDRDGDGWRDRARRLRAGARIRDAARPGQPPARRAVGEKNMKRVGLKMIFKVAKVAGEPQGLAPGKLMMWGVAWSATTRTPIPSLRSPTAPTRAAPTMRASR